MNAFLWPKEEIIWFLKSIEKQTKQNKTNKQTNS